MKKQKEIPIWAIILCIIGVILIILYNQWDMKNLYRNVTENMAYSIATITRYSPPGRTSGSVRVEFTVRDKIFEVSTKTQIKSSNMKIPDSPKGKQYLIVYNAKNPEECILLWDYPINDSTDYRRYMEYLKKHPISEFENNKR